MAIQTFTKAGVKSTSPAKLDKSVFGVAIANHDLLKQAYVAYLANGRGNNAKTKSRGEVSGGGKKPWRQKGTGRARFGSSRNPIWRGGGIAFGPTGNENYSHDLSTRQKRQAVRQALTMAAGSDNKLVIIEDIIIKDAKTATAAAFFKKIGVQGSTLVVVDAKSDELSRSVSNLTDIKLVDARYLTVYDILNATTVVITTAALSRMSAWLGSAATATKTGAAA